MLPVFLVSSCLKDEQSGANDALRKTWIPRVKSLGYDTFFCIGDYSPEAEEIERNVDPKILNVPRTLGTLSQVHAKRLEEPLDKSKFPKDILWLACPDGYVFLPWKSKLSCAWALQHGYPASIRCFTDTYIFAERYDALLKEKPWEQHDCIGYMFRNPIDLTCDAPFGGPSYILSQRAMQAVGGGPIASWSEDCQCGIIMRDCGFSMLHHPQYKGFWVQPGNWHQPWSFNVVSAHLNNRDRVWDHKKIVKVHDWYMKLAEEERHFSGACTKCGCTYFIRSFQVRCKQCGYPLASSVRDSRVSIDSRHGLVLDRDDLQQVRQEPLRPAAL